MEILLEFSSDFRFENFPCSGFDTNNRHIHDFLSQKWQIQAIIS